MQSVRSSTTMYRRPSRDLAMMRMGPAQWNLNFAILTSLPFCSLLEVSVRTGVESYLVSNVEFSVLPFQPVSVDCPSPFLSDLLMGSLSNGLG